MLSLLLFHGSYIYANATQYYVNMYIYGHIPMRRPVTFVSEITSLRSGYLLSYFRTRAHRTA